MPKHPRPGWSPNASRERLAQRNELETLAFPAIATGSHGYPMGAATRVAIRTVAAWLVAHPLPRHVTFCCAAARDAELYERTLAEFSI